MIIEKLLELNPTVLTLIIIAFVYLIKIGVVSVKNGKLTISNKDRSTHDGCSLYEDHVAIVKDTVENAVKDVEDIYNKAIEELKEDHLRDKRIRELREKNNIIITQYKKIDILDEQMNILSIKHARISNILNSIYFDLSPTLADQESFELLIKDEKSISKNIIRKWCRVNGFANMDAVKWENYVDEHSELLVVDKIKYIGRKYLDDSYNTPKIETMDKIKSIGKNKIQAIYKEAFEEFRVIAVKYAVKISELENEMIGE